MGVERRGDGLFTDWDPADTLGKSDFHAGDAHVRHFARGVIVQVQWKHERVHLKSYQLKGSPSGGFQGLLGSGFRAWKSRPCPGPGNHVI